MLHHAPQLVAQFGLDPLLLEAQGEGAVEGTAPRRLLT